MKYKLLCRNQFMNKKDELYKADKSLKVENNLKVEDSVIRSSSYDELKYIDEWISYMKDASNPTSSENKAFPIDYDEESSFSSILNFYMTGEDKNLSSSEDIKPNCTGKVEKKEVQLIRNEVESEEVESVDMCHKENLVDSEVINSDNEIIESSEFNGNSVFIRSKETSSTKQMNTSQINMNQSNTSQINMNQSNTSNSRINELNSYYEESNTRFKESNRIKYDNTIQKELPNSIIVNVTKIDSPVFYNKRPPTKAILSQYFTDDSSPSAGTFGLITEAKNRAMQQNKRTESDIPLRKFVIETDDHTMDIKDIWKLNDLKNKTIMGKLSKMSTKGYYTENWVTLRENFFSCYSTKAHKKSSTCFMNEKNGDIENPADPSTFLTRKYSIDLLSSRIYLCKKKGKSSIFSCYSEAIPAEADLIDVTDVVITDIKESPFGYKVHVKKDMQIAEITLNCLNFAIKTNDGYRFYKVNDLTEFLTWNVAFRFRLSQIPLNIG